MCPGPAHHHARARPALVPRRQRPVLVARRGGQMFRVDADGADPSVTAIWRERQVGDHRRWRPAAARRCERA